MDWTLRPAEPTDAPAVAELVNAAYGHYVARIGRPPGPMNADYAQVLRDAAVTVAVDGSAIVGVLVLAETEDGFTIENVAVAPAHQGRGLGRALLLLAESEARRAGHAAIALYTHELMTENLALYQRIGYVEFDRRGEPGLRRVYLRKQLPPLATMEG
jgi:ribosomal protein S18 acetylase RimI-like enzyme